MRLRKPAVEKGDFAELKLVDGPQVAVTDLPACFSDDDSLVKLVFVYFIFVCFLKS